MAFIGFLSTSLEDMQTFKLRESDPSIRHAPASRQVEMSPKTNLPCWPKHFEKDRMLRVGFQ